MFENLITDRTILDYNRWRELRDKGYENMTEAERAEWRSDMKGAYNASDLNRVGEVLNYLRDRLTNAGYLGGNEFAMRVDWAAGEIPSAAQVTAYLGAVKTVREALAQKDTTPPAPENIGSLDYIGANNIEIILIDIDEVITKMRAARFFFGDLFCGEIGG